MSTLYYHVTRKPSLSEEEVNLVENITSRFNSVDEIESLVESGGGEMLSFSTALLEPGVILEGTTELPIGLFPEEIDDFIYVTENWFSALSEIRTAISGDWKATLDGKELYWDEHEKQYKRPVG